METNISILRPEDWETFKELRLKALQTDPVALGRAYDEEVGLSEEEWRKKLEDANRKMYIAKVGDQPVGITGVRFESGKYIEHMAKIVSVFVDPQFRRQGIGQKLMARVLEDLRANPKIVKVKLSVNEPQEAAKGMYEKFGFRQAGIGKKEMKIENTYYDQIQMELIFEDKISSRKD